MSQRIAWIDCWKGLAIITVVSGHIVDPLSKFIFWFHMPLFFFISGYLYRDKTNYFDFFKKKFLHLIVPYISFLALFSLFQYASYLLDMWQQQRLLATNEIFIFTVKYIWKQVYGGQMLVLWFGVFWFVTCLFFTQQLYNLIYTKFGFNNWLMLKIMLCSYLLAMLNFWLLRNFIFPWNINVVAMALPFYWIGHMVASSSINHYKAFTLGIIIFVAAIFIDKWSIIHFTFNMKNSGYGLIIFNVIIALAGIVITQQLAIFIHKKSSYIGNVLAEIGSASMIIMYIHQPIQLIIKNPPISAHQGIRVIAGLLVPYIIYKVIINYSIMRRLFLGDFSTNAVGKTPDSSKI